MRFLLPSFFLLLFYFFILPTSVFASASGNLEEYVHRLSLNVVFVASLFIGVTVLLTFVIKNESERLKLLFFGLIIIPTIITTLVLVGSTLYLNSVSATGGPVHWHADFEIYYCGEKIELADPEGFSNKVGTDTFHEHNDNRIHVEGVVIDPSDVTFGTFLETVGGKVSKTSLDLPTTDSRLQVENGDLCPDGSEGQLQAFIYRVESGRIVRHKIDDLPALVISPHGEVPPGECIIVEFAKPKNRTDHLCESYEIQILKGKYSF